MTASSRPMEVVRSVTMIGAGGLLALAPVTFQAVGARVLTLEAQGILAVSLGMGAYLGQMIGAWVVEARLAAGNPGTIRYPRMLLVSSVAGGALLIAVPTWTVAHVIGLPLIIAGMNVGRLVSVADQRLEREVVASLALVTGVVVAALLSFQGVWSFRVITIGCALAGVVRFVHRPSVDRVPLRTRAWVSGETALTGFTQPALNAALLALVGPQAAVTFRAVSTVSGALEPVLAYTRVRLLVRASRLQVWTGAAALGAVLAMLSVLEIVGAFRAYLGEAWAGAGLPVLVVACCWRASTLITTVPFATLRRQGRTTSVFWLRAASSLWSFLIAVPVALTGSPVLIFAALLAAEASSSLVYFAYLRQYPEGRAPGPGVSDHSQGATGRREDGSGAATTETSWS